MNKVIHIPFDGRGKTTKEAAEMISSFIKTGEPMESIQVLVPTQWDWKLPNLLHPMVGVLPILKRDAEINQKYHLSCYVTHGKMGVVATPV